MPRDHFLFRKKNQLEKDDKSLKQGWDKQIASLCEKINSSSDYYTTSSCSGRIVLIKDSKEKSDDLFVKVWHDKVSFDEVKNVLRELEDVKGLVIFKQEPCIMHVACRTMENARKLIKLAQESGWKRNGIISSDKRIVVEINATDKMEMPIYFKKSLVEDVYLEMILSEANKKLKSSWEKIKKLEESF